MHVAQPVNIGLIFNGLTPYNLALSVRLAREVPAVRVHCVFTLEEDRMNLQLPPEIHAHVVRDPSVKLAERYGQQTTRWSGLSMRSLRVGREVYAHLRSQNVRWVMQCGYASLGHLWLLRRLRRDGIAVYLRGDSNIKGDKVRGAKLWLKKRILGYAIRRASGVMPMGEYGRQFFARYGAKVNDPYLVPCEPDYEFFMQKDDAAVEALCAAHGLSRDRRYLLYVGRFVQVKRLDLLIDAFVRLAEVRPDWDLLLAGDGELREALLARVPEGLRDRVRWLGFCKLPEVRAALGLSSVFVLPSSYEPWALVINEAAAAGLVIVASDVVGAARQIVRDGVSGRIFTSGDVQSLHESLMDVTDAARHEAMSQEVAGALAAWRREGDPVRGICRAMVDSGVLERSAVGSILDKPMGMLADK